MLKKYFLFFLLFSTGFATAQNSLSSIEKILVFAKNPEFVVKLKSNPTTGYTWQIKNYDRGVLTLKTHQYIRPNTKLIGAAGYELWKFKVNPPVFKKSETITQVEFIYKRPWEKEFVQAKTIEVLIRK